ncbi:MAG: hypothetical protein GC150_01285 [Rhizobiales bacterium]|nr:hypothetical protein [Hyphomicrobiales bacterium]
MRNGGERKWSGAARRARGMTIAGALLTLACLVGAAEALEADPEERTRLKDCEKALCAVILKKEASEEFVTCDLQKTWAGEDIDDGAKARSIDWGFGDARCSVALSVAQAAIVEALTKASYELAIPKHEVACTIEGEGEATPVGLTLAPKITFKDGQASSVTLGVGDIVGPSLIQGVLWTAAKLESSLGMFQSEMASEVNEFIGEKCAKRYPELAN